MVAGSPRRRQQHYHAALRAAGCHDTAPALHTAAQVSLLAATKPTRTVAQLPSAPPSAVLQYQLDSPGGILWPASDTPFSSRPRWRLCPPPRPAPKEGSKRYGRGFSSQCRPGSAALPARESDLQPACRCQQTCHSWLGWLYDPEASQAALRQAPCSNPSPWLGREVPQRYPNSQLSYRCR
jgi:hypothetical protein